MTKRLTYRPGHAMRIDESKTNIRQHSKNRTPQGNSSAGDDDNDQKVVSHTPAVLIP
jgi:hypothetical protein